MVSHNTIYYTLHAPSSLYRMFRTLLMLYS